MGSLPRDGGHADRAAACNRRACRIRCPDLDQAAHRTRWPCHGWSFPRVILTATVVLSGTAGTSVETDNCACTGCAWPMWDSELDGHKNYTKAQCQDECNGNSNCIFAFHNARESIVASIQNHTLQGILEQRHGRSVTHIGHCWLYNHTVTSFSRSNDPDHSEYTCFAKNGYTHGGWLTPDCDRPECAPQSATTRGPSWAKVPVDQTGVTPSSDGDYGR